MNRPPSLKECVLFLGAFVGFAYFHQGGGWSQNGRFAEVRAIVEQGRLPIDSYLIYMVAEADASSYRFMRLPISNGTYMGGTYVLRWRNAKGEWISLTDSPPAGSTPMDIHHVSASGDLAYYQGHFHPNKAPLTTFLAVPAYALLFHYERVAHLNPDDWWILTVNAWLTSAFSVGLLSAAGCPLFYRLALNFAQGNQRTALLATVAFAWGTLYFPFGTMLYEHNIVAVCLLVGFYLLYQVRQAPVAGWRNDGLLCLAGLDAGYAAITNYVAAVIVVLLGVYLLSFSRSPRHVLAYVAGVAVPFLSVCAYHFACYGSPFVTGYQHENPIFQESQNAPLSVLQRPQLDVLLMILFSPFRGLFFSSPVLLMGVVGWCLLLRAGPYKAEAWLFAAIITFFILFNCSFNGWTGGWGVGPRYLVPALPFLALPLVFAFERFFKTTAILAVVSVGLMFVTTAVDPQCPLAGSPIAMAGDRPLWRYSPLTEYELPLFFTGRPGPFLRAQADALWEQQRREAEAAGLPPEIRAVRLATLRAELDQAVARGDTRLFPLAFIQGPVSANPQGIYEGDYFRLVAPGALPSRWNSFNAGEFLFPGSRLSLLPWLASGGLLLWWGWRRTVRQSSAV